VADKTIRNPNTLEERVVDETALPFFVNSEQPWELLDAAGRKAAHQPAASTSKES
jgi:hypothetical protein